MKKGYLLFFLFLSSISIASKEVELNLKTDSEIKAKFGKRNEDKEKGITKSDFSFEKLGYSTRLIDLDVNFKNIGLKFGTVIKSSRENIKLNDWYEDVKNAHDLKKRNKNHDIMAKIYANYESKEFYGLKNKTELTYYVDNFFSNKMFDKDKDEIIELGPKSEFIEDDGTKQILGNTIFKSNLKGKIKKTKTDLELDLSYKANQLIRFDKDESYLKTKLSLNQALGEKLEISLAHNLHYDLYNSSKPFDTFDNDLDEYPDYIVGNYVDFIKQDGKIGLKHYFGDVKEKKEFFDINASIEVDSQLLRGENKKSKITTPYHIMIPNLQMNLTKQMYKDIYLSTKFDNKFKIKYTKFYPQHDGAIYDEDLMVAYYPKISLGLIYDKKFKEGQSLKSETGLSYTLSTNIAPYFSKPERFRHDIGVYNKTNFDYKLNEKLNIKLNSDLVLNTSMTKGWITPTSDKFDIDFNLDYKINEKLKLNSKVENKLSLTNKYKLITPDKFKDDFKAHLGLNYTIFENKEKVKEKIEEEVEKEIEKEVIEKYKRVKKGKKYIRIPVKKKVKEKIKVKETKEVEKYKNLIDKLNLDIKAYTQFEGEFDYQINADINEGKSTKTKLFYLGKIKPLVVVTSLGLDTKLNYERNISDKLNLKTGINLETKLDLLSLRSEKLFNYKPANKEIESDKEKPLIRDNEHKNYNIGGSVTITPNVAIEYKLLEKLKLKSNLKGKIKFEREVINLIKDEDRIDKGKYSYIDKKFGFKEFVPTIKVGLEYTW